MDDIAYQINILQPDAIIINPMLLGHASRGDIRQQLNLDKSIGIIALVYNMIDEKFYRFYDAVIRINDSETKIEEVLKKELDIPVMHDDQHGTAIITGAALINALEIANKDISKIKVVVNGAGASAQACTKMYISLGVNPKNIYMFDSKGILNNKRKDLNKYKSQFINNTNISTLKEALDGADLFLGLSKAGTLNPEYIRNMNDNPIIFALSNPVPEIIPEDAKKIRKDIIMATGRSDYPNQVNNVLGFPYIFRGALDTRASAINEEMKLAACYALANLAKEEVPQKVLKAYNKKSLSFGRDYIIPTPFDNRLNSFVATAVAKAAVESGVARKTNINWEEYSNNLMKKYL